MRDHKQGGHFSPLKKSLRSLILNLYPKSCCTDTAMGGEKSNFWGGKSNFCGKKQSNKGKMRSFITHRAGLQFIGKISSCGTSALPLNLEKLWHKCFPFPSQEFQCGRAQELGRGTDSHLLLDPPEGNWAHPIPRLGLWKEYCVCFDLHERSWKKR